jgi:hypothetical protein
MDLRGKKQQGSGGMEKSYNGLPILSSWPIIVAAMESRLMALAGQWHKERKPSKCLVN